MAEVVKTVLVGLGNVNLGLLKILIDKKEAIAEQYNTRFKIVGVVDSSGMAISEKGFAYEDLINLKHNKGKVNEITGFLPKAPEFIPDCIEADLLIDGSPVNLEHDNAGIKLIKRAIIKGWHVVLANKAPLVLAFDELTSLAEQHKTKIRYSATVCGGLPVINVLSRDLKLASLQSLYGIFNATSNFVLQELEKGVSMEEAIKEAQNIGAAETDPSLDISGQDTANKLYIIMKSFSDFSGSIKDIEIEGIEKVTAEEVQQAAKANTQIKLVASAYKKGREWKLEVRPTTVAADSFIGSIKGWEMGIEIKSDLYESISLKNYEADPTGTCAAVLRDMLDIQPR
jgi:homoserine dehydrogenase